LLPLKDLNRSSTTPHVNRILIIANIIIFLVFWLSSQNILLDQRFAWEIGGRYDDFTGQEIIAGKFVMVPGEILKGQRLYTLFTSMFMHGSWIHLFSNMLFLYIFGDNIEDTFGHLSYLAFYLVCGLLADLTHISSMVLAPTLNQIFGLALASDPTAGVIGASGAISGVLGAYLVLFPRVRIIALAFYVILPLPSIVFIGIWFVLQWIYGLFDVSGGVAYFAHIGGFIAGMILALTIGRKRKKAREKRLRL